ncbi:MAG: bifunctional precorrin-2 dehydrogenase/sirohydrochlorin ferrochelatase [Methanothrix sp.]|nr:bifunctional precorrin-2 dehydrogenase/sirohydrochlorin ferrochelatase [Methanothrix sp.]
MAYEEGDHEDEGALMPLFLDLSTRLVVIFGGGGVGERKAEIFSRYCQVKVVSRDFSDGLLELAERRRGRVITVQSDLSEGFLDHLAGAFIAVPATSDSELNRAIEEEAKKKGILVNAVEGRGDIVVPSILRRGSVCIAISTENPGLTKYMRLRLDGLLEENISAMARLLHAIRKEIKETIPVQKDRALIIWRILEDREIWRLLDLSYEKAYIRARSHIRPDERDSLDAGDTPQGLDR